MDARDDKTAPRDGGLSLADLVDAAMLQSMMDDFYALTSIPMALIDLDGTVIVGAGWQHVCTHFHRTNAETCAYCIESDTVLTADIPAGEMQVYKCKNGMWDAATPVFVGDERVGNLFAGQFFFDDEPPDLGFFKEQAERYGFDEREYVAAVEAVPRLTRETVDTGLRFLTTLSHMVSQLSFSNAQRSAFEDELKAALAAQTSLTEELVAERGVIQAIMENTDTCLAYLDPDFNFVAVNATYALGSGHTKDELIGRNHFELFPDAENEAVFRRVRDTGEPVVFRAKPFEFADQPWRGVTYWDWRLSAVKDADGAVTGLAFSLLDVTRSVREKAFSDALNRLNDIVHSDFDFDSVLAQFLPELAAAIGCEVAGVASRSPRGEWAFREVFGMPEEVSLRGFGDGDLTAVTEALKAGRPFVVTRSSPTAPVLDLVGQYGVQSLLVAPLSMVGRQFGAIACGYVSGPGEFDESSIDFLGKIAASMTLALNNSRLFHDERRLARLSEALAKVNEILLSALTLEDVVARLVGEASMAAGADRSLVIEVNDGVYTPTHVRDVREGLVGVARDAAYFPGFALAASLGKPVLIEDNWTDPRTNHEFVISFGLKAFQLLPLSMRGKVTHVLALAYDEPQTFDEEDYRSAERMTAAMSVALTNARLFENEHRIADRLQEALLALPDHIAGVEFAQAYHSATEAARVGGDFYDIFGLTDHHIGITIGDISGKGIDAAMLTALVKNTIRAHASEKGKSPAQVLKLTNDIVYKSTPTETFATVFFAVLDWRNGRLLYANAGHTPAALLSNGTCSRLQATGPLLGALAHGDFEQESAPFGQDDLLFLYTDGLTESRRDGRQYGEDRVFALLSSTNHMCPRDVVADVIGDVMSYTDNRLRDDLAILAVRRLE